MNEILKKMSLKIKGSKSIKKKKMHTIALVNNVMVSLLVTSFIFEKMSDATIEKFCSLWNQNTGFRIGLMLSEITNKQINPTNMNSEISSLSDKFRLD